MGDPEKAAKECAEIEVELMELQAQYEQYFLGVERRPPTPHHTAFKKRVNALRNTFVNSTPVKFRIQNLQQRVTTFERLWERTMMEIEAGTYKRDLYKAKRHGDERKRKKSNVEKSDGLDNLHIDEDLDLSDLDGDLDSAVKDAAASVPAKAPSIAPLVPSIAPAVPQVASARLPTPAPTMKPPGAVPAVAARPAQAPARAPVRPPAPVGSDGGLNDQKIRAIYDAYVMAKRRCGEDTSKLSLDTVATTLRSQVPTLMKQHNAKSVEFKVVIKDGKAVLRALPKE